MEKYVVLGASGQLGRAFQQILTDRSKEFVALGRSQADLAEFERLRLPLDDTTAVINCAAYTQVDKAEEEEAAATRINGDAVGALALSCARAGARFVHFSTDYVFDGKAQQPYRVDQARSPINAYGRSKARGEELWEEHYPSSLLIRTSWVYAPWGANFVRTMARLLREKDNLRVVDDQRGRPTHVLGLAERTLGLLEHDQSGVFHITDDGECSWYDFARAIRRAVGAQCDISPCTSEEFPRPAPRPSYSVLDISGAQEVLGPPRHYEQWLDLCVQCGL